MIEGSPTRESGTKDPMNLRLVGLDGPLKGEVVPVTQSVFSIGRDRTNRLCIPDRSVSRRHCTITVLPDGQLKLTDHDSRNGTFVNELPVKEKIIAHGDELRIGACLFVTLVQDTPAAASPSARLSDGAAAMTRTIVRIPVDHSLYMKPEEILAGSKSKDRLARNLSTLLSVSAAIRSARGLEDLVEKLLQLSLRVAPASEGAMLLFEPGSSAPIWTFGCRRESGAVEDLPVPGEAVLRALEEDMAILENADPRAPGQESGEAASVAVAPMPGLDGIHGVIYLASSDPRVAFEEDHLQYLTALGSVAGPFVVNALRIERLNSENRRLREESDLEHDMVGESAPMQAVYRFISKVAPTDSTVLIQGESGTGKELVARAIHRNSPRAGGPFVAINCAAITETLLESELFGHEKGAFTGAIARKPGRFELAAGGTLFLDEVSELPLGLQAKLLRVLQEREIERVGGTQSIGVNVRVLAATNQDLRQRVAEGKFREDLYYRLDVVSCRLPPLRERGDDVLLLANYFVHKYSRRLGRQVDGLSTEVRACLRRYEWPGNVRELANAIERAIVLGSSGRVVMEDLPEAISEAGAGSAGAGGFGYHDAVRQAKRKLIRDAIARAGGSHAQAAKDLGVNPTYLSRLIRNLELKPELGK